MTQWPKYQRVEVEWIDSHHQTGWLTLAEANKESAVGPCRSIGYLFSKDATTVMLVQSLALGIGDVANSISIPAVAIVKITPLRGGLK